MHPHSSFLLFVAHEEEEREERRRDGGKGKREMGRGDV